MKFRFSIRDIFFCVVIAAILTGWYFHSRQLVNEQKALTDQMKKTTYAQQDDISDLNFEISELKKQEDNHRQQINRLKQSNALQEWAKSRKEEIDAKAAK